MQERIDAEEVGRTGGRTAAGHGTLAPWAALVVALVIGGLLFSARATDAYAALAGLLFAGFGVLLGFRLLNRVLP